MVILVLILFAGFAALVGTMALGLPVALGAFLAGMGLVIPLVVGCLAPDHLCRTGRVFVATALGTLALIVILLIPSRGLLGAWQLASPGVLLVLGYVVLSIPALLAGAGLRRQAERRRWLRRALVGLAVAVLVGTVAFGVYLRGLGLLPFARGSRLEAYDRLWVNLERFYSHWETSPVAPEVLSARYRPRIEAADRACRGKPGPCQPYRDVLRDMLAELQDGHTHLVPLPRLAAPAISVRPVEGQAAVVRVEPGSDAEAAGLLPGMIITAVDGQPVQDALTQVPGWAVSYTAPHTRRYAAYQRLLAGAPGETVSVDVLDAAGHSRTVTLHRTGSLEDRQPGVHGARQPGDLAYIAVDGLVGQDVVAAFDELLDGMLDAPGLILDLRGNGGGNSMLGDRMVGRLITQTVSYGEECLQAAHPMHGWATGCFESTAEPRGRPYLGPVAVLIDTGIHSSGEWMVAALCDTGRARCFGRTTAGDSGNPVFFYLPGSTVQFSTGSFRRVDGTPLNGVGVSPHVEVQWTLDDLRQGRDPDLEAARAWLQGR